MVNNQLNAISRIDAILEQNKNGILINSFAYSNLSYGPLIWYFTIHKGINKIEKVQQRSLKFILNDCDKTHFQLLDISKKPSIEIKKLRILITEIFKTLNDSNPIFMTDIFHYCQNVSHKKHNLHVHSRNTSRYGNNSLCVLGAHIWNSLPENIKSTDSVYKRKNSLKEWYGCECYLCVAFNYAISATMFYSPHILKSVKRRLYYIIMRIYFNRMHKENSRGRALGLDPFFSDGLCYFLLPFYFRTLILYSTDFNSRINKAKKYLKNL